MVRQLLCSADPGAGPGLAGDPGRPAHADRRAHRLGQDARRVSGGDRSSGAPRPRRQARRRDAGGLRLAAEGAVQRHPAQSRGAAGRHPRGAARARTARCRDPHLGAHRRYAAGRARAHAPPAAAHPRDHAGVALHPARLGVRPRDAGDHAHGDRRRNPRHRAEQARRAPGAVARAPGALCGERAGAHRPVGDAEADRGGRALAGRRGIGWRARSRGHDRRHRPPAAARSRARTAGLAARGGDVGRGLGAGLRPAGAADRGASHHAGLRQHAAHGRARGAPVVASGSAKTRSPRTTAAWRRSSASTPSSG